MRRLMFWFFIADMAAMPFIFGIFAGGSDASGDQASDLPGNIADIQRSLDQISTETAPDFYSSSGETPVLDCDVLSLGDQTAPSLSYTLRDLYYVAGEDMGGENGVIPCMDGTTLTAVPSQ